MTSKLKMTAGMLVATLLLSSSLAMADVSGKWQGYGSWAFDGSSVPCLLTMEYADSTQELKRIGGTLDCQYVAMYSDPLTWLKQDDTLILDGRTAGNWTTHGFTSQELASDNVEVTTTFDSDSGAYKEIWRRLDNNELIYTVEAKLKRK